MFKKRISSIGSKCCTQFSYNISLKKRNSIEWNEKWLDQVFLSSLKRDNYELIDNPHKIHKDHNQNILNIYNEFQWLEIDDNLNKKESIISKLQLIFQFFTRLTITNHSEMFNWIGDIFFINLTKTRRSCWRDAWPRAASLIPSFDRAATRNSIQERIERIFRVKYPKYSLNLFNLESWTRRYSLFPSSLTIHAFTSTILRFFFYNRRFIKFFFFFASLQSIDEYESEFFDSLSLFYFLEE